MQVEVKLTGIDKFAVTVKVDDEGKLVSTVTVRGAFHPVGIARIMNLFRQGCPIYMILGSDQAAMDLELIKSEPAMAAPVGSH